MSSRDRTILIVSVAVVALLLTMGVMFALVGSLANTSVTKTVTEPTVEQPKKDTEVSLKSDKYEDRLSGAKEIFVSACSEEPGVYRSDCVCMYEYMDSHYTNDEFDEAVKGATDNDKLDGIGNDAVNYCVEQRLGA